MERVKNLGVLLLSMNIVWWTVLFSVEFVVCSSNVSDSTTQSLSTSTVSELSSKSTKKGEKPTLQPLPLGDDTFYSIREGKKVFVDKTSFIEELLDDERKCILFTRPSRFGKTTFLQMLEAFFMGKKDLFEGTYIYPRGNTDNKNGEWKEYPVVSLHFGLLAYFGGNEPSVKLFKENLHDYVQNVAEEYELGDCKKDLKFLLEKLEVKFRLPVIVLIDEYDRAFTTILRRRPDGAITKREAALLRGMKRAMEEFFNAIKISIDEGRVRLAYVTGAARLAFDSLPGSGPNNVATLEDIYSCMVGFTENEIGKYLKPHVDEFAKTVDTPSKQITERLLKMYGGYLFSDTGRTEVVNSLSVMKCLAYECFGNYWCTTDSTDFIIAKMLAERKSADSFKKVMVPESLLFERDPIQNEIPAVIFMLVYGYLSVKKYDKNSRMLTIGYPNDVIEETLINQFNIRLMLANRTVLRRVESCIFNALHRKDLRWLTVSLNKLGFRNNVPAEYREIEIEHEFTPTSIIYTIFKIIGVISCVLESSIYEDRLIKRFIGDLDLQIVIDKNVNYVFEIKYYEHDEEAIDGIEQLLDYIINNEKAFLDTAGRCLTTYGIQPTEFYLISLNCKKDENGETSFINSFVGIHFQATDPKHTTKDDAATTKRMKIWFRDMQVSNDAYKEILRRKYGSLPLDRAVW